MTNTRIPTPHSGGGTTRPAPSAGRDSGAVIRGGSRAAGEGAGVVGAVERAAVVGPATTAEPAAHTHPRRSGTTPRGERGIYPHPLTWWIWTGAIALALTRVSNPLVLGLTIAAVITTALTCREPRSAGNLFSTTLNVALAIGGVILIVRTGFYILLGLPDSSRVILELPGLRLPWFTNLRILGPVHLHGLVNAVIEGARLAGLVIAFGAASALSNPRRALRFLPSSLHHLGTAAVIAVAGAPQLVETAARVRQAQQLRAPSAAKQSAVRRFGATLVPVLSSALDHALVLAGSMDSRGYARARSSPHGVGAALVVALLAAAAGTYGLLDAATPPTAGVALLTGGFALAVIASIITGRAVARTRYFTPAWTWRETVVALAAAIVTTATIAGTWTPSGLGPWRVGSGWPPLPLAGALIVVGALLPIVTRGRRS